MTPATVWSFPASILSSGASLCVSSDIPLFVSDDEDSRLIVPTLLFTGLTPGFYHQESYYLNIQ